MDKYLFSELYTENKKYVLSVCKKYCGVNGAKEDIEDVCSEVFLRVLIHDGFDPKRASFNTWVYSIAKNASRNFINGKKYRPSKLYDIEEYADSHILRDVADPESILVSHEKMDFILNAIDNLSGNYREIIKLRLFEDASYDTISEITNIPIGTVKSRIYRARKILQSRLNEKLFSERV